MRPLISRWTGRAWRSSLLFGALGTVARSGAQIFLLPAVVLYLTPEEQAMWWVFLALGNFANLADFGFGSAIARVYSYLWAGADDFEAEGLRAPVETRPPNLPRIRTLNATLQYFYARVSFLATVVLGIGGSIYLYKAIGEAAHPARVWELWAFYLLTIGFTLATTHWLAACLGIDRVREVQVANLTGSLVFAGVAFSLLRAGAGLSSMVAAAFARALVLWYIGKSAFSRVVPSGIAGRPELSLLRRIWPNASKFGILSIGSYLIANGNVLISRYFLPVEVTAAVGLTGRAGDLVATFSTLWLQVKWPQITMLRTQGRLNEMAVLFARRLALVVASFAVAAVLVILIGNAFLSWKHSQTRLIPLPVLIVYFLYLWQQVFYGQFGMLAFTENVVPFFRIGLYTGVAAIALSLVLTWRLGLWGLILAPLIAETAYSAWFTVRRGFRGQPLNIRQFVRAALLGRTSSV